MNKILQKCNTAKFSLLFENIALHSGKHLKNDAMFDKCKKNTAFVKSA